MKRRVTIVALAVATTVAVTGIADSARSAPDPTPSSTGSIARGGSLTLLGADAQAFTVPSDVVKVWSTQLANGTTQTRYQQMVGGAKVLGGQLTVLADRSGRTTAVIGAYFPPPEGQERGHRQCGQCSWYRCQASRQRRPLGVNAAHRPERRPTLLRGRHPAARPPLGALGRRGLRRGEKQYDAVAHGDGTGVKGDTKTIDTTRIGNTFFLRSRDLRQETYDASKTGVLPGTIMTDEDDHWTFNLPKLRTPSQAPGVDAHYYANVVDDFYATTFGRDSLDDNGMQMISSVHVLNRYCNAFWNGEQMAYGDGDGKPASRCPAGWMSSGMSSPTALPSSPQT